MGKRNKRLRDDDSKSVSFVPILTSSTRKVSWNEFQQLICWVVGQGSKFEPPIPVRFKSNNPPKTVAIVIIPYLNYSDLVAYLYAATFFKNLITKQSLFQMSLPKSVMVSGTCRIKQSLVTIEYSLPPVKQDQAKNTIKNSLLNTEQMESNLFPQSGKEFDGQPTYTEDKVVIKERLKDALMYECKPIKKVIDIGAIGLKRKKSTVNIFPSDFICEYESMLNLLGEDPDFPHLLSIDCEMCITKNGSELTRVSIVDPYFHVIFDSLVLPDDEILDYCTKYSGITRDSMQGVDITLDDVLQHLKGLISSRSILVGHSLENDFLACKIKHNRVIDTSVLYQETNQTFKFSLASLAWKHMKVDMHRGSGHDSVNDARVAMALAINWIVKGSQCGEMLSTHICNAFADNSIVLKSKHEGVKLDREIDTLIFDAEVGENVESNFNNIEKVPIGNLSDEEMAKKFADAMSKNTSCRTRVGICFLRDIQREALNGLNMNTDRILAEIPCSTIHRLIKNASEATDTIAKALDPGSYLFIASCSGDAIRYKLLSTLCYVMSDGGERRIGLPICENLYALSRELGAIDFDLVFEELKGHAARLGANQLTRESQLAKTNFKAAWGAAAIKI
ncbi:Small RNA degrading nuclease 5 [Babesia microti strain RI]|uniref:Small RNA degrading nuclease 5 n=1 Tax=Babesia microti (strain RI) TaxID=1133968 RepID=A0A1R4ABY4_BABMR|nr:Small RNA degrading nuclease 5 [Babesia microti strain RI]SJK86522.1 Small RNA degrading nuclease 5 [Babesia microti strain RI]|eukprot:XP_021338672.1 Small RNA degrading nuclease 5 [Babesia microti strain RI]